MTRYILAIVGFAAIAGCSEHRPPSSPLAQVAKEPMQPGVGLGELKLAETTLGTFTREYGVAESVVTTDGVATKIDFLKAGLAFLFRGAPACGQKLSERVVASADSVDINGFLLEHPDCETMLLESIAAYIPESGEPLYEGETVEGIGLNATRELAERAYQATQNAVSALESGMPMPDEQLQAPNELSYPGVRIYLGKDKEGREVVRKLEVIPRR